jgi:transglutaminase-like putative cysteine protease
MDRRSFLKSSAAATAASSLPTFAPFAWAQERRFDPRPGTWRTYEITTQVEVLKPVGLTRVWLPIPSVDSEYQKSQASQWSGNARTMQSLSDGKYGADMLYAEFAESESTPTVTLTSRFQTQNRATDWSRKVAAREDAATLKFWTAPTDLMPTDGIVRDTAVEVTRGKRSDIEKTQAIYDWIVANTYREPKVRGCGVGDIKAMLETQNFGGKCGDINALFVGLCRAVGIPARDVYGIRLVPSAFGYRELSGNPTNLKAAQHCRAEVFLREYGWVPMDPADVGKVMRLETGDWIRDVSHPVVAPVNKALFGGWEGNWLAFNTAHDVTLPNARTRAKLGFLMYPQCETAEGMKDSLDPDNFKYTITARELSAA